MTAEEILARQAKSSNATDRAWAELSEAERQALRRGEPLPSATRGRVVRDLSHEADRVFEEVRQAGGSVRVDEIKAGRNFGWTGKAIAELVKRGLLRRVTLVAYAPHQLAEDVDVPGVGIVPGFERALLMPPASRRVGERPMSAIGRVP